MERILFICLGNICRSPLAEGILRKKAAEAKVTIDIDSAGIGDWHVGQLPDPRAIEVGTIRGYAMNMRTRQIRSEDFERFDRIIAMDHSNIEKLLELPGVRPEKLTLARSYDPRAMTEEVPDPYYGTIEDFELVADMLESACDGILTSSVPNR